MAKGRRESSLPGGTGNHLSVRLKGRQEGLQQKKTFEWSYVILHLEFLCFKLAAFIRVQI